MDDIKDIYWSLRPVFRDFFVIKQCGDSDLFWRSDMGPNDFVLFLQSEYIHESWYVDMIISFFALIREAEIMQNQKTHIDSLSVWLEYRDLIYMKLAFKNIEDDINDFVYERYFKARYFLNGSHCKWKKTKSGGMELVTYVKFGTL